jgi:hypothetical protein
MFLSRTSRAPKPIRAIRNTEHTNFIIHLNFGILNSKPDARPAIPQFYFLTPQSEVVANNRNIADVTPISLLIRRLLPLEVNRSYAIFKPNY